MMSTANPHMHVAIEIDCVGLGYSVVYKRIFLPYHIYKNPSSSELVYRNVQAFSNNPSLKQDFVSNTPATAGTRGSVQCFIQRVENLVPLSSSFLPQALLTFAMYSYYFSTPKSIMSPTCYFKNHDSARNTGGYYFDRCIPVYT